MGLSGREVGARFTFYISNRDPLFILPVLSHYNHLQTFPCKSPLGDVLLEGEPLRLHVASPLVHGEQVRSARNHFNLTHGGEVLGKGEQSGAESLALQQHLVLSFKSNFVNIL